MSVRSFPGAPTTDETQTIAAGDHRSQGFCRLREDHRLTAKQGAAGSIAERPRAAD